MDMTEVGAIIFILLVSLLWGKMIWSFFEDRVGITYFEVVFSLVVVAVYSIPVWIAFTVCEFIIKQL